MEEAVQYDIFERKYYAVSIKHSMYDKIRGKYVLWGWNGPTADDQERCFGGYTHEPDRAEIYSLSDFQKSGYGTYIKFDEPVPVGFDLCKKYKKFDTVLVNAEKYNQYLQFI